MNESTSTGKRSIKVGVITDQTGPLSFAGIANANIAKFWLTTSMPRVACWGGR